MYPHLSGACKGISERYQATQKFPDRFRTDVGFQFTSSEPQTLPKIYTLADVERVTSSESFAKELTEAVEQGFVEYSQGKFNACPIQTMGAPPMAQFGAADPTEMDTEGDTNKTNTNTNNYAAQTCVKSGYMTGGDYYVVKVASGGYPFPSNSGLLQIYSQQTGKLEALLLDDGICTEMRTAAAGAVAAKYLAPQKSQCIGILGTGVQARYQLEYLRHVVDCQKVMIWGRDKTKTKKLRDEVNRWKGWEATVTSSADWLLELCSVIITTTSAREVLLGRNRIPTKKLALHITCIGSDSPGKMEISTDLIERAELLVADSRGQTQERGEFATAIASNLVSVDDVVELGELVVKEELHRSEEFDNRLTIFDSSGVAFQDCVVAQMVFEKLQQEEHEQEQQQKEQEE
mmetsp:Transcript_3320/g.5065  ORF Transcript_3320/g.5065 Transcript_3320/m.5065 type:complete len:404 (+) Transcript_3320:144-1355(+)|eukprot:CAMPEP_0195290238 /NCGR_PEP_ID=MMETSP0707-20130614/6183_1 /TAXON_ID=33640 /ORGANISM="Asterionellopsis glacialis, Strain CCMP134" /LENGTH=403 /DNA_ID=CAMNT_0040350339 /DNA_START=84 /DNA_END=1295 /DNA_ORIENTATION=+